MENTSRRIIINTLFNYVGTGSSLIANFIILVYIIRALAIEDYGQYNVVISTQILFALLLQMGLPSIIMRFLPEFQENRDIQSLKRIALKSLLLVLGIGLFLTLISLLSHDRLLPLTKKFSIENFLTLAIILGFLRVEVRILESVLFSTLLHTYKNVVESVGMGLKVFLFIASIQMGYGIFGLLISIGLVDLFLICFYFIKVYSLIKTQETLEPSTFPKRRVISFGFKEYLAKLVAFFWDNRVDAYIIAFYLGNLKTGLFYFSINLINFITSLSPGLMMKTVVRPLYARQYTRSGDVKELNYLFQLNNKVILFFVLPFLLGTILLVDKIVGLIFDPKYLPVVSFFPVLACFMIFNTMVPPVRSLIMTLEKNIITVISNVVIFYKIPVTILLTKWYGLSGTAWAFGTSTLLYFLIELYFIRKYWDFTYPWEAIGKVALNSLVMGGVIVLLRGFIKSIPSLILVALVGGLVYLGMSYINKVFSQEDRFLINRGFFGVPVWQF